MDVNYTLSKACQNILCKSGQVFSLPDKEAQKFKCTSVPVYKYGFSQKCTYYRPLLYDEYNLMITNKRMSNGELKYHGKDVEKLVVDGKEVDGYISIYDCILAVADVASYFMDKIRRRTKYVDECHTDMMQKCVALETYLDKILA